MLIAVSGSSRSILSDWNVTLDEVNSNIELAMKFQEEILTRKVADDSAAKSLNRCYFTERTPLDLVIYATITLGPKNECNDWLIDYTDRCIDATKTIYDGAVYLRRAFAIQHDGTRSINPSYSMLIDVAMLNIYQLTFQPSELSIITDTNPNVRLLQAAQLMAAIDTKDSFNQILTKEQA
jgi:hypothetical protein